MQIQSLSIYVPSKCFNKCKFCVSTLHPDKTQNLDEFWTVEYQYVGDDFYWASSGKIYDKERATSVYDELKNKYPVIKLVHNTRTQEVIKVINCTKG